MATKVAKWNNLFLTTYEMCIVDGYAHEDAMASARTNASDTVKLTSAERVEADDSDPRQRSMAAPRRARRGKR